MNIEVGKAYRTRGGKRATVGLSNDRCYPFTASTDWAYTVDATGRRLRPHETEDDLIALWDSPADWTTTKPTAPGRYWWCDGKGGGVQLVEYNELHFEPKPSRLPNGYWLACEPPAPHVAPVRVKCVRRCWAVVTATGNKRLLTYEPETSFFCVSHNRPEGGSKAFGIGELSDIVWIDKEEYEDELQVRP